MVKGNVLVAGILIIASLVVYTQVDEQQIVTIEEENNFTDSYPYNNSWEQNGTHFQTTTDSNGYLVMNDSTNDDRGVFESNKMVFNGSIEFKRFSAKAAEINQDQHEANITVYSLDKQGSIVESREFELTEKSKLYKLNFTKSFSGYSFEIELETNDTTSPKVESVNFEGIENVETTKTYGFKTLIVILMALSGIIIGLGG